MASLVPNLRKTLFNARSIAGQLGFRVNSVAIVIARTGSGEQFTGDGQRYERVTPITEANQQAPKVRWLKDDELAVGNLEAGTVEVGPITPEFSGGGTSRALLTGDDLEAGAVRLMRITGAQHPDGADYRITDVKVDRALRYKLRGVPVGTQR